MSEPDNVYTHRQQRMSNFKTRGSNKITLIKLPSAQLLSECGIRSRTLVVYKTQAYMSPSNNKTEHRARIYQEIEDFIIIYRRREQKAEPLKGICG